MAKTAKDTKATAKRRTHKRVVKEIAALIAKNCPHLTVTTKYDQ